MTRHPHITGFIGYSGSGKTTLILALLAEYRRRGRTVGVAKHTHHEFTGQKIAADAERFAAAGAAEVVLISPQMIHRWSRGQLVSSEPLITPAEMVVVSMPHDVVLVEGFKSASSWPRIALWREGIEPPPLDGVSAIVTNAPHSGPLRRFSPDDVPALADFLDTIPTS